MPTITGTITITAIFIRMNMGMSTLTITLMPAMDMPTTAVPPTGTNTAAPPSITAACRPALTFPD